MVNKHFFKTLLLFSAIIALALAGIFWVNSLEESETQTITENLAE